MLADIGHWDVALILVVSVHATSLAYIREPRWKAFVYVLPVPFTIATLALGRPLDVTHALGLLSLPVYPYGVRWLHLGLGLPIVAAIATAAGSYGLLGIAVARVVPVTPLSFWLALGAAALVALLLESCLPHRDEPGHRSPLPVPVKFTVVACVIIGIVLAKRQLQGFMTCFPMVGTVAAYEARKSLWTLGRQIPTQMLAIVLLFAVCRLTQGAIGLLPALAAGWCVFLLTFVPLTRRMWRRADHQASG